MQLITNEQVAALLGVDETFDLMRGAFLAYRQGGAMQARVRIDSGATKLSMMGAILPGIDAVGAKIYTTIAGRFTFAVVLFSATDGRLLAIMEGDAMTEFRTAAVTAVAADALARRDAQTLAVFGTGVQARAHLPALLGVRPFARVLVVGIDGPDEFAAEMARRHDVVCTAVGAEYAARHADVIVTATRSATPLFDGAWVRPGTFVAAIGSSKPDAREVDERLVRRAARIVVEWKPQAQAEAGDLTLCAPGCVDWQRVEELADVIGKEAERQRDDIILYKAIGVGLEDVALAEFVYRKLSG